MDKWFDDIVDDVSNDKSKPGLHIFSGNDTFQFFDPYYVEIHKNTSDSVLHIIVEVVLCNQKQYHYLPLIDEPFYMTYISQDKEMIHFYKCKIGEYSQNWDTTYSVFIESEWYIEDLTF